ncbi:hypothetical protein AAG570_004167 [Ranatra chinensis]|uniref:Uncharacterized protein n=1 Tax=Ranatra chinensis TaxID=642074 RepID=A0ABD0Y3P3_9HEMI
MSGTIVFLFLNPEDLPTPLIALICFPVSGAQGGSTSGGKGQNAVANRVEDHPPPPPPPPPPPQPPTQPKQQGPHFDKAASKNVTALLGKTAYLNCKVKNLGNKTVSQSITNSRATSRSRTWVIQRLADRLLIDQLPQGQGRGHHNGEPIHY